MRAKIVWTCTFVLVAIAIAAVVRRLVVLSTPSAGFDVGFGRHPALTLLHLLPALVFVVLAPTQFVRRWRARYPVVHRWIGRLLVCLGLILGGVAFVMSFTMAIGGLNEIAATVLFDVVFLFCLLKGLAAARRRDFVRHREWMIRMFGTAMGVATVRPIMGVFFATSTLTHLTPHDFFGIAFWIGFSVTLMAAQGWIDYTRR